MNTLDILVPLNCEHGIRLDRFCAQQTTDNQTFKQISRSRLKNGMIQVTINGKPAKLSKTVKPGDHIQFSWEDPIPQKLEPENIPLSIVYEDENVTVVNKEQGMVTHPAAGNWSGTLVHALLWHWGKECPQGVFRPGIVHRLDKDTSGVIITARNPDTESWLQNQFSSRKVRKVYIAILNGIPKTASGIVTTAIHRDPKNRKRYTWSRNLETGKIAKTAFRVLFVYGKYSVVLFRLYTGRTHQLRVHSQYLGAPILGDPIYGKKSTDFPNAQLMLHAKNIRLVLPGNSKPSSFSAPIPKRFKSVIETLKVKFTEWKAP